MSISTPRTYEYNNITLFGQGISVNITKDFDLLLSQVIEWSLNSKSDHP